MIQPAGIASQAKIPVSPLIALTDTVATTSVAISTTHQRSK